MKTCPKCNNSHCKPGTYCSRGCANGHIQTVAQNKKRSELLSGRIIIDREDRNCERCDSNYVAKVNDTRKYCSKSCSIKAYNTKIRENYSEFKKYKIDCQFDFNVYDYPAKFDLSLIKDHGWYSASNKGGNLSGVSRDHRISVRYGFNNNISAPLISHPANCKLLRQTDNSKKYSKCEISLDELLEEIKNW